MQVGVRVFDALQEHGVPIVGMFLQHISGDLLRLVGDDIRRVVLLRESRFDESRFDFKHVTDQPKNRDFKHLTNQPKKIK